VEDEVAVNYQFKTKPYAHQKEAMRRAGDRNAFALFMEMGTGKSKTLIDNLGELFVKGSLNFAFIIAPKGVYRNWVNKEIPEHMPDMLDKRVIRWVSTPNKEQQAEMRSIKDHFDGLTIFVMNVEAFSTKKGQAAGEWLAKKYGANGLIAIDESTTIKNPKAKRTKALCKIAHQFKFRRILTGSPVTRSPMDLYSQCEFLGPRTLGFDSFFAFQGRYAIVNRRQFGQHQFNQVVGFRHLEELTDKVDSFSYRVLKKDCLDLPPKTYTVRYVSVTDEQAKLYNELRHDALTLLDNGELITAQNVMTQMLRLQQVLSGHLKTDNGDIVDVPTKRLEALLEICEETSGKVLIWSRFRYDIQHIQAILEKNFPGQVASYYGDTPDADRQGIVTKFQDPNSGLRFFIGNPSTAGYGLTLTEANTVVYYANDFNLETRIQSEDRCHRIGQQNPVTYIDLITENTIDERIVQALRNKIDLGAKVLGEEAREWLKLKPQKN
jgi:SNF2 family DNA or RNA helicase